MKILMLILIGSILIIYTSKYIIKRNRMLTYQKAGKKWENIVKEISDRN